MPYNLGDGFKRRQQCQQLHIVLRHGYDEFLSQKCTETSFDYVGARITWLWRVFCRSSQKSCIVAFVVRHNANAKWLGETFSLHGGAIPASITVDLSVNVGYMLGCCGVQSITGSVVKSILGGVDRPIIRNVIIRGRQRKTALRKEILETAIINQQIACIRYNSSVKVLIPDVSDHIVNKSFISFCTLTCFTTRHRPSVVIRAVAQLRVHRPCNAVGPIFWRLSQSKKN